MTDYEQWLEKVRSAMEGKNKLAIARWLAARLDTDDDNSIRGRLYNMLEGGMPGADLAFAITAWMEAGGPDERAKPAAPSYNGSPGGKARAEKLSPERRKEIAAQGRAARSQGIKASRQQGT